MLNSGKEEARQFIKNNFKGNGTPPVLSDHLARLVRLECYNHKSKVHKENFNKIIHAFENETFVFVHRNLPLHRSEDTFCFGKVVGITPLFCQVRSIHPEGTKEYIDDVERVKSALENSEFRSLQVLDCGGVRFQINSREDYTKFTDLTLPITRNVGFPLYDQHSIDEPESIVYPITASNLSMIRSAEKMAELLRKELYNQRTESNQWKAAFDRMVTKISR